MERNAAATGQPLGQEDEEAKVPLTLVAQIGFGTRTESVSNRTEKNVLRKGA